MKIPGFTTESLAAVQEMLYGESPWEQQFLTGRITDKLPRENKTTHAQSLQGMDIDSRPGKQKGSEGKQKEQSSESIFPVSNPKGNPQQGPRSRSDLKGLAMFDELGLKGKELSASYEENCRPRPQPRSTEQRQATQQAQQAAQQQGQTFDQQPQQQVQEMGRQGGQAERKPTLPVCNG
jgi:hypothetical protein